jgi:hypothetical protein
MNKTERICRAICAQRGLNPDEQRMDANGFYYIRWMEFKELVETVILIIEATTDTCTLTPNTGTTGA